mgnify:CR=1 FL=1
MRLIIRKTLLMFLLLSLSNVLTGFQLSAQEQNKKFSVKADNVTLKEAIEVVRKQGNYSFLIRNNDIDLNKKVSVNVDKGTINDVMAQLLTGTGISYEVNGNRVVIFHAAVPEKEQGKAFVLKGKVTDPSGEGVIGANVKVLNSTEGTITDMDGNFSLSVTPNARLSVSYIGYATQEVVVKNQTDQIIASIIRLLHAVFPTRDIQIENVMPGWPDSPYRFHGQPRPCPQRAVHPPQVFASGNLVVFNVFGRIV